MLNWEPFETARALPKCTELGKVGSSPCDDAKDAYLQMMDGRARNTVRTSLRNMYTKARQTFHPLKHVLKWSPNTAQELIL